jgi:hypothetical protein
MTNRFPETATARKVAARSPSSHSRRPALENVQFHLRTVVAGHEVRESFGQHLAALVNEGFGTVFRMRGGAGAVC